MKKAKDALVKELTNEPFNLTNGPLHRFALLRLEDTCYLFLAVMHHIITDGWSLGVLFHDLTHFYNQLTGKVEHKLPHLAIQYVDYAVWQRALGESGGFQRDVEYWKKRLDGAPSLLSFPTDRPRQGTESAHGSTGSFMIPSQLTAELKSLASTTESSLFIITLAGFSALLNRYCRQDDVVVGTPVANRKIIEFEKLIGLFVNTLALRIIFEDNLTAFSLIDHVRSVILDAFSHEDAPFEQVVNACVDERNLDHAPLFQVMFALQNAPVPDAAFGDCRFTPIAVERRSSHFDLGFFLGEKDGGVEVSYEYRTSLFNQETIDQLCIYYVRTLEGMVSSPGSPIAKIPLITQSEWSGITSVQTRAQRATDADVSVITLFEQQCRNDEARIAISGAGHLASYAELNLRANRIATLLRENGVVPDTVVALALDRSVDMVAAVVGILKAGGACLPVDLANPLERNRAILIDSGVRILLTSSTVDTKFNISKSVARDGVAAVICIDQMSPLSVDDDNYSLPLRLDDLAYVLYTSGSTGKPKGVAMPHRSLVNLVEWQGSEKGFENPATTLQFSPLCFDVSFQELFCTLCSGGTLIVIDEHVRRDSGALLDVIDRFNVERVFMPFVALQQLAIAAISREQFPPSLRDVITAGEQLRITDPVRQFFKKLPLCRLHNQYGPTESHVVTALTLPPDVSTWPILPSIGWPIHNCAIYILEKSMELAPIGVPGELFISGSVCARGYLNRPELTRERFIPDSFNRVPGRSMYRSGDLARYLPDGSIECMGRIDHQVKIRGFRVELQEIESVLDCLSSVKECAVIVDDQDANLPELAAYVVGYPGCDTALLRLRLAEKLPSYMVPRYFVLLETMPLTPSGKIDRQALLRIERTKNAAVAAESPCRPTEIILCELWARVLSVPTIRVNENFFDAGGHSLLATQLISEVNALFSAAVPIRALFDFPTVAEFAGYIESPNRLAEVEDVPICLLQSDHGPVLSYAQERLWVVEQSLGVHGVYNMPIALECEGELDIELLRQAISQIILRHETLRTVFIKDKEGNPEKIVHDDIDFTLIYHDLRSGFSEAEKRMRVEQIVHEEANAPFDVERGPLIRAGIIEVGVVLHVILVNFHHIICDGWSIGVFSKELSSFYKACLLGEAPEIEPLAVQYNDFALWQRQLLEGRRGDVLRKYWLKNLEGTPVELEIPRDVDSHAVARNAGDLLSFSFDHIQCENLQNLSRSQSSTLFMTMFSAFSWLIFLYTGQEKFLVGTPIANRNHKSFEQLIGFFVNMLPLRVDLSGDPTFIDVIKQVRGTCLDAYTNQDMPFDELVRLLNPERIHNRHPLVQVVFVLQNTPEPKLTLGKTKLTPVGRDQTVAKYDLLMSLTQSNGTMHGTLEYSTELFTEATAKGIVDQYMSIVNTVLKNPQVRILDPKFAGCSSPSAGLAMACDDVFFEF